MLLHLSVILFTGGLCPSIHHRLHDWGGVSVQGGLSPGGVSVRRSAPDRDPQTVISGRLCILPECILVMILYLSSENGHYFSKMINYFLEFFYSGDKKQSMAMVSTTAD